MSGFFCPLVRRATEDEEEDEGVFELLLFLMEGSSLRCTMSEEEEDRRLKIHSPAVSVVSPSLSGFE